MKGKVTAILLSLILMFSVLLGACSKNEGTPAPSNSGNQQNQTGSDGKKDDTPKEEPPYPITIMLPLNIAEAPPDKIKNELEKVTNTKLTYNFQPADTYEEKLNSSFATGSLPQVTYLKNQATFVMFKDAIRDGQFWEIGPYLDEFPNLKKLKPQVLKNTEVDGKLYSLYIGRPLARQGIIYRKDWADNLGLSAPETTDDLFEMLKAFTEDNPDGTDRKTIGLTDRNDLVYGAFKTVASYFGTPNNWGEKDGQLLPEFMFDEYIETMDWFKKVRDAGYMNQDFAATSKTDQINLFVDGTAGVYIGSMQDVNSLHRDLTTNVPEAVVDVHSLVKGPSGEYGIWAIPGYNNVVLFPKDANKTEDDLRKVLAFFDKMMTPEVSNLMFWGIEGDHYEVVDGAAKVLDDAERIDREVKGFKDSVIGEPETSGRLDGYHTLEARIKTEQLIIENENYAIHDPAAALDSATFSEMGARLQEGINDATYKYIYGQIDRAGFDKAVEDWKSRGGNKIIEEINEAYKNSK